MEDRGEVLDVAAAGAELELAAAVHPDAARLAVLVGAEQRAQRPQARRLDVDHPRREGQGLDVGDAVDGRVPGDAVAVGEEDRVGLLGQLRVLDPGVGEGLDDAAVEDGVGGLVDDRADVEALEVDRVDRAGGHEPGDELGRPLGGRVELEAQRRVALQALASRGRASAARPGAARRRSAPGAARGRARRAATCPPGAGRGRARSTHRPTRGTGARPRAAGGAGHRSSASTWSQNEPERPVAGERQDGPGRLQDLVVGRRRR